MTASSPVSLDALIAHVRGQEPDTEPLAQLTEAATISVELGQQADALLGHFVDRARRSGASWTEIGVHLGVTKQAARKRFVPSWDGSDPVPEGQFFSRATLRTRAALLTADHVAREHGRDGAIDTPDLLAGVLVEPRGLATAIVTGAGIDPPGLYRELGLTPDRVARQSLADGRAEVAALRALPLAEPARQALRDTVAAALRLGHNYVGTEHVLLGLLAGDNPAAAALRAHGLDAARVEGEVQALLARYAGS